MKLPQKYIHPDNYGSSYNFKPNNHGMIVKIEVQGLEQLRRNLDKKSVEIDEAGKEGLKRVGAKILAPQIS